jgi:hypothetical protein
MRAGQAWKKHDSLIKKVIEENPVWRRPLRRLRLRWKISLKGSNSGARKSFAGVNKK